MASQQLVILVRHAQSEHHVRRLTGGWTDTPLTPLGHEQAMRCAARLHDELGALPVQLYTSDLERAMQTARAIGDALGVEPKVDGRLREYNNGASANLTWEECEARFPGPWGLRGPIDEQRFPGSETLREFYERAGSFLDTMEAGDSPALLVTHGGTIHCLVAWWLGLPAEAVEPIRFDAHTTAISVLYTDEHGMRAIERLNDATHLGAGVSLGTFAAPTAG